MTNTNDFESFSEYLAACHQHREAMKERLDRYLFAAAGDCWELWAEDYGGGAGELVLNRVREIFRLVAAENGRPEYRVPHSSGPKRKSLSARKSLEVFARDNYECVTCGTREDLTVDHIHPVSKGGTNDMENLRTLCRSCNARKGAKLVGGDAE